jgi:hypothetical protein
MELNFWSWQKPQVGNTLHFKDIKIGKIWPSQTNVTIISLCIFKINKSLFYYENE